MNALSRLLKQLNGSVQGSTHHVLVCHFNQHVPRLNPVEVEVESGGWEVESGGQRGGWWVEGDSVEGGWRDEVGRGWWRGILLSNIHCGSA